VFNPWLLPSLSAWLESVTSHLDLGVALLEAEPSMLVGMLDTLEQRWGRRTIKVYAQSGHSPAAILGQAFRVGPSLDALLQHELDRELAILSLQSPGPDDISKWSTFLDRFASQRANGAPGPAVLLLDSHPNIEPPSARIPLARDSLRRGDLVIWAEEHLARTRSGSARELAVSLAVELCGWRLDLSAELAKAGLDDLSDPLGWLNRRSEDPTFPSTPSQNEPTSCPLALLRAGDIDRLRRRVWHAQLVSIFPRLEEERLTFVADYRRHLSIDAHLKALGVKDVDEIELGALRYQLRSVLNRPSLEWISMLGRIRNSLAHRRAADPADVRRLLEDR
jgi:hypothetical protein